MDCELSSRALHLIVSALWDLNTRVGSLESDDEGGDFSEGLNKIIGDLQRLAEADKGIASDTLVQLHSAGRVRR